jgi:hypothetical protein
MNPGAFSLLSPDLDPDGTGNLISAIRESKLSIWVN